jgi:hypothetical protein
MSGTPQTPQQRANEVLNGELPLKIAECLIKILCVPHSRQQTAWRDEVATLLRDLHRSVERIGVSISLIQQTIDDHSMEASEVLDLFSPEEIDLPPPDRQLSENLVDYGFKMDQYQHPSRGIQWKVFLAGKEIADTAT